MYKFFKMLNFMHNIYSIVFKDFQKIYLEILKVLL
jgi:hypothetical protein